MTMAIQLRPGLLGPVHTAGEQSSGSICPTRPNAWRLLTYWRFDIVLGTAAIVLGTLYVLGVVQLRSRGDAWSSWRALAWVSGLRRTADCHVIRRRDLRLRDVQRPHDHPHGAEYVHPPCCWCSARRLTLLLRAVEPAGKGNMPGPREWALSLMHSKFTAVLSNAIVALVVFVVSLYGQYFIPLFVELIRYHWGHLLMNIHFLLTGYLYYWAIIGVDPGPKRLPHIGRLGMLFALMPFHAFFGVAVMSMNGLVGKQFYPYLALGWDGQSARRPTPRRGIGLDLRGNPRPARRRRTTEPVGQLRPQGRRPHRPPPGQGIRRPRHRRRRTRRLQRHACPTRPKPPLTSQTPTMSESRRSRAVN